MLLGAFLVIWGLLVLYKYISTSKSHYPVPGILNDIVPIDSQFSWKTEKPRKYRPYKRGPFHMTMGIKTLDHNEWLLLEDTYKDATDLKKHITQTETKHTVLANPAAKECLFETYDLCLNYLLLRYPQYFVVDEKDNSLVHNKIRNEKIYRDPKPYFDLEIMVKTLSQTMEEDFLILMLDDKTDQYYLRGGSFAFPSGFDPAQKTNLSLRDIHGPVPLYKKSIEKSMDKFFRRLKVGEWIYRLNWTVQADNKLYAPGLDNTSNNDVIVALEADNLDFSQVCMRCERQCLLRLPKTKALLFTIRTYMTPLSEIREEEDCLDMCEAIDNLPDSLGRYKKRDEWGNAVKSYLRCESNGIQQSS